MILFEHYRLNANQCELVHFIVSGYPKTTVSSFSSIVLSIALGVGQLFVGIIILSRVIVY
jgi:hypothetical protein